MNKVKLSKQGGILAQVGAFVKSHKKHFAVFIVFVGLMLVSNFSDGNAFARFLSWVNELGGKWEGFNNLTDLPFKLLVFFIFIEKIVGVIKKAFVSKKEQEPQKQCDRGEKQPKPRRSEASLPRIYVIEKVRPDVPRQERKHIIHSRSQIRPLKLKKKFKKKLKSRMKVSKQ